MNNVASQAQLDIEKLELARNETLEDMEHLRTELRNMAEPSADEADLDAYEREKTLALIQALENKVASIERALRMAQRGTYGVCEGCGQRIDPARLEIIPEATMCLNCQRQTERRHKRWR